MMDTVPDALVDLGLIDRETFDMWRGRLFASALPGAAPWDPWLCAEWNKEPRSDLATIARYYDSDAHVVFQSSMMAISWEAMEGSPDVIAAYVKPGTRMLDYGSGGGAVGLRCAKAGARVTLCDVSKRLLAASSGFAAAHGTLLDTVLVVDEVPRLPGEYEVIVTVDALEHVQRPVEVLRELVRVLAPGGLLWMEVFFGGHELAPYHLPEVAHFGQAGKWAKVARAEGLDPIEGQGEQCLLWTKSHSTQEHP